MMCARMIMILSAYDVFIPHRTRSSKKTGHQRTSTWSARGPWSGCILRQVFLTQAAWSGLHDRFQSQTCYRRPALLERDCCCLAGGKTLLREWAGWSIEGAAADSELRISSISSIFGMNNWCFFCHWTTARISARTKSASPGILDELLNLLWRKHVLRMNKTTSIGPSVSLPSACSPA